jgi:hypothetical protein
MAGYSSTPLAKKLGIKDGHKMKVVNMPEYYFSLFSDMPEHVEVNDNAKKGLDFVHFFTKEMSELNKLLPQLKKQIVANGMIWVSWPKKSAKVATDVTENLIREVALQNGLVDIKVCAVDDTWSGLKLVIPVAERK